MADIVYLVRHAAPPAELRGRFWGRGDPGVDPSALRAVPGLRRLVWHHPDRLFVSPLARALATAAPLADSLRLELEVRDELAEADFGLLDGMTYDEIAAKHPDAARRWEAECDGYVFPGGESVAGFLERVETAWRGILAAPDQAALVVTHAGVIAAMACLFFGLAPARRFAFRQDYGAISAFVRKKDGTGWVLRYFNHGAGE